MIVRPATPGKGFDTSTRVTLDWLQDRRDEGYTWCADYLPLPGFSPAQIRESCISAADFAARLAMGYEVSLIQHPRYPGWDPTQHDPAADAKAALDYATNILGAPLGMHFYNDAEGVKLGTTSQQMRTSLEMWATVIREASQKAAVYCGFQVPLTPLQWWLLHGVSSYWTDPAHHHVEERGCAIVQGRTRVLDGVENDEDLLTRDLKGETPMVAASDVSAGV